jgi:hypothetical protein
VLAYYYVWWDPEVFNRTLFQPLEPYNSDDLNVMQRHVNEAKSAGIDGFIVDWYGDGDRTDANFAHLLDIGGKSGFSATVHFDTPHFWGVDDVVAQLKAFYSHYGNNPALLRYQGQPVIFFWQASTFDNGTWSSIRSQVDPNHTSVWIADGDQFGILGGDAWDGISPYAIAWSNDPAGQLPRWAASARRPTSCGTRPCRLAATTRQPERPRAFRIELTGRTTRAPGMALALPRRRGLWW